MAAKSQKSRAKISHSLFIMLKLLKRDNKNTSSFKYATFHTHFLRLPEVHTEVTKPKEKYCLAEPDNNVLERIDSFFFLLKKKKNRKNKYLKWSQLVKLLFSNTTGGF